MPKVGEQGKLADGLRMGLAWALVARVLLMWVATPRLQDPPIAPRNFSSEGADGVYLQGMKRLIKNVKVQNNEGCNGVSLSAMTVMFRACFYW